MTMKNILLVFTGGTIGSAVSDGVIDTAKTQGFKLLQLFHDIDPHASDIHFTTLQPLQILSENMAPKAWQILINAIESQPLADYDGIIITHGTDTLAYTAAALSYYFNALTVPMLLVSSDYSLDDPRANGLSNFRCAVDFIRQRIRAGVFVPYANQNQMMQVHHGARLTCSLQLTGDFYSVQDKPFMGYENQVFTQLDASLPVASAFSLSASFSEKIIMIKPYPGFNYKSVTLEQGDVVLHDLYHSGTACASNEWGDQYSLVSFIERCTRQGVSVYLAPAIQSAAAYQSTHALLDQGAKMLWNMSIESAYVKLLLAYGNFIEPAQIQQFLATDVAGERV